MVINLLLAAGGLVLLTIAADHLVLGSSRLAAKLRISPVVVGVVVIGLGTSAPEFLVSGMAAAGGRSGIAVGNLVGSNILNLTLVLGVAALIAPVAVRSETIRREVPLAVAGVGVFAVTAWVGLDLVGGVGLLVPLAAAMVFLVRWAADQADPELVSQVVEFTDGEPAHRVGIESLRAGLGLIGVLGGAQLLVTGACDIATRLGVSQVIIGFTLVALGTSLPELVTTIQAQRRGETDLVVGNLFGSNLFNSLAGGAVVGLAAATGSPVRAEAPLAVAMVFVALLASALLRTGLRLTRPEAGVLLLAYALTLPLALG
jgi:cation:H+ antiporter